MEKPKLILNGFSGCGKTGVIEAVTAHRDDVSRLCPQLGMIDETYQQMLSYLS